MSTVALFLRPVLLLAALAAAGESLTFTPGCEASCGGVDMPYPFGIGNGCFRKGFEIDCVNNGTAGPAPVLAGTSIRVLRLSVDPPVSQVMLPVGWQCYNASQPDKASNWSYAEMDMNPNGVYRISSTHNMLVVLGCNTFSYTASTRSEGGGYSRAYYTGCMSYCNNSASAQDGACAGVGCCHVDIPPGLTDSFVKFREYDHSTMMDYSPCDYAFLVDRNNYTFRRADLKMDVNRNVPVWLDWAIRDDNRSMSCADTANSPDYACVSAHSGCVVSTNGPGYVCNCTKGYEGNPYVTNGCTNINECARPEEFPCYGVCKDTDGSYDCKCRPGYQSSGDPKEKPCNPKFPLAAKLALGITLGISFLIVALLLTLIMIQKRKLDQRFAKNGGEILQNVTGLTIFTKEKLKKITKNSADFIGKGSFGNVYMGTLPNPDNRKVAVKASIEVNEARKAEFTEEVKIQMNMIHKNILKLVGCCLQLDVPMLVYEYAPNGSLQDILHGKTSHQLPLPLDLRLDIAIGSAEGLKYMHSYAAQTIRHGDVKPDNILLDENFTPKISDFGLSKLLKVDEYFAKTVVGCKAYIDPVYIKSGLLTQKSDTYSFGAVLLELITRKPIVYDGNCSLLIEFLKVYEKENSGRAMFDKDIATEEDISILEEIGRLAIDCLNEKIEDRPEMTEVAERLVMLRRARRQQHASNEGPH